MTLSLENRKSIFATKVNSCFNLIKPMRKGVWESTLSFSPDCSGLHLEVTENNILKDDNVLLQLSLAVCESGIRRGRFWLTLKGRRSQGSGINASASALQFRSIWRSNSFWKSLKWRQKDTWTQTFHLSSRSILKLVDPYLHGHSFFIFGCIKLINIKDPRALVVQLLQYKEILKLSVISIVTC